MSSPFDRTRLWLAEFGDDPDRLADALARTCVELTMPVATADAEISFAMAATLLFRLDEAAPRLHLTTPGVRQRKVPRLNIGPLGEAAILEHVGLDSVERASLVNAADPVIRLVFGPGSADGVTISSSGWRAEIGQIDHGEAGNELAAAYAGVLAAVEAIKAMLTAVGIRARALTPWTGSVSLWDYGLPGLRGPSLPAELDLDEVVLLGCGGIGSATGWVMSLLPLVGRPALVDDDHIDLTSLNRHLTAGYAEAVSEIAKVDALGDLLASAGAHPHRLRFRWQDLNPGLRSGRTLVAVSVDHDPTRRDLQLDLPRLILNAGNSDTGLYRVTRHDFLHGACLRCIARADLRSSGPEQSFAQRLGLPLTELKQYLDANEPLPAALLERGSLTQAERAQLQGVRARKALGVVCDRFAPLPSLPALSWPPLSAAPGILLANEVVKAKLEADVALNTEGNMVAAGVLRGPHSRWLSRREKQPGCECGDLIYRQAYERRWSEVR